MSLRWIHENLEAPTCDEECSDIDDSCSDDSYDSDLFDDSEKDAREDKELNGNRRNKRETKKRTNVTFEKTSAQHYITPESCKGPHCVIWDPRRPAGNPVYSSLVMKLYCRTGHHLGITPSGRVRGVGDDDKNALLRITSISFGVIRIQSNETGLYLAIDKKGRLYGEAVMSKDNTEWEQWSIGSYDAFRSRKYVHCGWWVGIKKNGRAKPGSKTSWGQKAIQFLAVRQD